MPVNIDTVYQTVQALANKEQRGYLTPQEFNLFANQAQLDIFEQYFYDLNALREKRPQSFEIGDSVSHIMEKLEPWYSLSITTSGGANIRNLPSGRTGKLFFTDSAGSLREISERSKEEILNIMGSSWHLQGSDEIFYVQRGHKSIEVFNLGVTSTLALGVLVERILGQPSLVYWGYMVVNEKAIYNPNASVNFELDSSEQPDLVAKILKLAGISIEDQELYQAGATEESLNIQQENK